MLGSFKLGWPSALRSASPSASAASTSTLPPTSATTTGDPAASEHHGPASSSSSTANAGSVRDKRHTAASHRGEGVPASTRYFAIFDPRPPPTSKGKGKERAQDDEDGAEGQADDVSGNGGQGDDTPPSTTVLFYSSPSEATTMQSMIHRRLGLASAVVQFSTELNHLALPRPPSERTHADTSWPNAQSPTSQLPRWSVTASKTRTLTLRVRPYIYLHVVIDLPRLPRPVAPSKSQSVKESKSRTTGSRPATVKWEYVGHAVVDEPIFEAMAKAWNAFVVRTTR
ncbi:hypothetical protein V8E36_003068 [Tilletia maclaganii]